MKRAVIIAILVFLAPGAWPLAPECVTIPASAHFSPRIKRVARSIARHEGFCVQGSIPARQHNPGGLVFIGQPDARRGDRGYAAFDDDVAGYLALLRDLEYKTAKGLTLGQIMRLWNTNGARYAAMIARETGIGEGELLQ